MTAGPQVSVVVPHFSDLARLDLCLKALAVQTWPGPVEIIVADNASPEGQDAVAGVIDGRARLVIARERGPGPTRNTGVAAATGEILAFTDCDCRPEPGWLAAGLEALSRHDIVGGRGFTVAANLFCGRALFETVGGFGTSHPEDVVWCQRAAAAGYSLGYAPDAVVGHPARRTWGELLVKARRISLGTFNLYVREPRGRAAWLRRTLATPVEVLRQARRIVITPKLRRPSDRAGALAIMLRLRWWSFWDGLRLLRGKTGAGQPSI